MIWTILLEMDSHTHIELTKESVIEIIMWYVNLLSWQMIPLLGYANFQANLWNVQSTHAPLFTCPSIFRPSSSRMLSVKSKHVVCEYSCWKNILDTNVRESTNYINKYFYIHFFPYQIRLKELVHRFCDECHLLVELWIYMIMTPAG